MTNSVNTREPAPRVYFVHLILSSYDYNTQLDMLKVYFFCQVVFSYFIKLGIFVQF